jgi:hypothetical protein
MSSIGMMDAAFFVGKNELLSWLNELLQLNYTKVEQCANGAAYCQIMDAIYPVRPRCSADCRRCATAGGHGERGLAQAPCARSSRPRTAAWSPAPCCSLRTCLPGGASPASRGGDCGAGASRARCR